MNTNSLETYAINKNKIKINFVNSSLELTILTPEIIRVFQNRGSILIHMQLKEIRQ